MAARLRAGLGLPPGDSAIVSVSGLAADAAQQLAEAGVMAGARRVIDRIQDQSDFAGPATDGGFLRYDEGLYVGYRAYDRDGRAPLFPFGHG